MSSDEEEEDMHGNIAALKEEAELPLHKLLQRFAGAKKERKSKLKAQKSIEESISSYEQCSSSSGKPDDKSSEACSSSKLIENGESNAQNKEEVSSTLIEENEAGCSSSAVADDCDNSVEQTKETTEESTDQPSSSNTASTEQAASKQTTPDQQEPSSTNQAESSSNSAEAIKSEKKRIKPTHLSPQVSFLQMLEEIDEEDSDDDSMLEDEDDSEEDSEMYDDSEESDEDDESESDEEDALSDEEAEDALINENGLNNNPNKEHPFRKLMFDEGPGKDSGCTAVICLLKNNKLYVANAGDSRAVLCRDGKAVEMSEDHKPTSEIEYARIKKAGGKVTQDGRVNGGLNLSRAFGDHSYKINKDLPLEEQMITALPDIRTIDILPEDDFIVIACDGIW